MIEQPSNAWFRVFPGPTIPDVLAYVGVTWERLRSTMADTVAFHHDEPTLTDNLCEALGNREERYKHRMMCDFQPETWELRRAADGTTTRVGRADIRVILGAPGTPHLVFEFKKLNGSTRDRWRYCLDGISRFVEGKYGVGHSYGVMCGFSPNDLAEEAKELADYIKQEDCVRRLRCIENPDGRLVTVPSAVDPVGSHFDTTHEREPSVCDQPIVLVHTLLACTPPLPPSGKSADRRSVAKRSSPYLSKGEKD